MMKKTEERRPIERLGRSFGLSVAVLAFLGGCSDWPDAANPAEWYKDTADYFAGEDPQQTAEADNGEQGKLAAERGQPAPGADQEFPDLSSVPSGLSGDTQGRRYAEDVPQRQAPSTKTLGAEPPPPPKQAATAPPPPAMPKAPVTVAQPSPPSGSIKLKPPSPPSGMDTGVAEFAPLPSGGSVQETFMARLSQQLPVKDGSGSVARTPDQPAASSMPSIGQAPAPTVIISSLGVEKGPGAVPETAPPSPAVESSSVTAADSSLAVISPGTQLASGALKVATIQFENGSASLKSNDRRVISGIYNLYRKQGGKVHVVGHASSRTRNMDPVKHKMVNYQVSVDRADSVTRELMKLGVPEGDIFIDARSDAMPLYYETMPSGEAGNRRTEVYLER